MSSSVIHENVLAYYRLLDEQQIDALLALYAGNIVYNRCGTMIEGMPALSEFFHNQRGIQGIHRVKDIITVERRVIVRGWFEGKTASDAPMELHFAEFYDFDDDDKICVRESYLATGFELTK